jgi:hypothetical protein
VGILTIGLTQEIPVSAETEPTAEENVYSYVEADGETKSVDAADVKVITSDSQELKAGWYIVTENVTISERIVVEGDVNLILADGAELAAKSGITVSEEDSLTIYAQSFGDNAGKLSATAKKIGYAGIGGYVDKELELQWNGDGTVDVVVVGETLGDDGYVNSVGACGTVEINGGNIYAAGCYFAVGIGGGIEGAGGSVEINNGTVTANGAFGSAGIGNGAYDYEEKGNVTVNGGTVTATGGSWAAGIGGSAFSAGCNVTITGGTVTAVGGRVTATRNTGGAGIGIGIYAEGCSSGSGTVTISGGTVTATGGEEAAGIGGGANHGPGADVTISGGTVTATAGKHLCSGTEHHTEGEADHTPAGIGNGGCDLKYDYNTGTLSDCVDSNTNLTAGGTFSTGVNGTAVITTSTIMDESQKDSWSGSITLNGGGSSQTTVYGSQNLERDLAIDAGDTLTIVPNGSLTVNENVTLSNSGTIVNNGTLTVAGTLTNNASISNSGTIQVAGTFTNLSESEIGTVQYKVNVTGGTANVTYAAPGTWVTLTPAAAVPSGMVSVWKMEGASCNGSFVMPSRAVCVSYEGYREIAAQDSGEEDAPEKENGEAADEADTVILPQEETEQEELMTAQNGNQTTEESTAKESTAKEKKPGKTKTEKNEPQETQPATESEETITSPSEEHQSVETDTDKNEPQETQPAATPSEEAQPSGTAISSEEETTVEEVVIASAGEIKQEASSAMPDQESTEEDVADLSGEENQAEISGVELISAERNSSMWFWLFLPVLAAAVAVLIGAVVYNKKSCKK